MDRKSLESTLLSGLSAGTTYTYSELVDKLVVRCKLDRGIALTVVNTLVDRRQLRVDGELNLMLGQLTNGRHLEVESKTCEGARA